MSKKKPKTAKSRPKGSSEKPGEAKHTAPQAEDGKTDFGGLPDIDLKKNLGCG